MYFGDVMVCLSVCNSSTVLRNYSRILAQNYHYHNSVRVCTITNGSLSEEHHFYLNTLKLLKSVTQHSILVLD